jgi:hypothetical protein
MSGDRPPRPLNSTIHLLGGSAHQHSPNIEIATMLGFDLTIFGTSLGVLGSFILAKSYLAPSFARQATQTFWDQNPYLVRNQIMQRIEALTGTFWVLLGFLLLSVGTVFTLTMEDTQPAQDYWIHFTAITAVTITLFIPSSKWIKHRSKQEYVPMMIYLQRGLYEQCSSYIHNNYREQREIEQETIISEDILHKRRTSIRAHLDQIGQLIDIPRKPHEMDREYFGRLSPLFLNKRTNEKK